MRKQPLGLVLDVVRKTHSTSMNEEEAKETKRLLQLRRRVELKVVQKHDKSELEDDEVWFIVDTRWLNRWTAFIEGGEPPGPLTTKDLIGADGKPIPSLQAKIDYRAVCPMVYFTLKEWHSKDDSPEITRYECNIHSQSVVDKDLAQVNVRIQVATSAPLRII